MRILRSSLIAAQRGEALKMKPALFVFTCVLFFVRLLCADPAEANSSKDEGVIILGEIPGQSAPANISFATIQWVDYGAGFVIDSNGTRTSFLNRAVRAIIYYDRDYYSQIDQMRTSSFFDQGIKNKEIVIDVNAPHLTSDDLPTIQGQIEALKFMLEVNESADALIKPSLAVLNDDVDHLSNNQQLVNGQWMAQDAILPPGETLGNYVHMLIPLTPVTLGPCLLDGPTGFPQDIERVS